MAVVTRGFGDAGILVTGGLGIDEETEETPDLPPVVVGGSYGHPIGTFGPFRVMDPDEELEEELLLLLLELT